MRFPLPYNLPATICYVTSVQEHGCVERPAPNLFDVLRYERMMIEVRLVVLSCLLLRNVSCTV